MIRSSAHITYNFSQVPNGLISENQQQINYEVIQKRQNPRLACITLLKDQKIDSKSTVNDKTGAKKHFSLSANIAGRKSISHPVIKVRHFWDKFYCNKLKINHLFKNKKFSSQCDILIHDFIRCKFVSEKTGHLVCVYVGTLNFKNNNYGKDNFSPC